MSPGTVTATVKRLADRGLKFEISEAAEALLGEEGFDPVYGARPLRRLVQSAIGDPLARTLLAGEIRSAFSMTEPENSGADPTTMSTLADQNESSDSRAMATTFWLSARRMRVETWARPARGPR